MLGSGIPGIAAGIASAGIVGAIGGAVSPGIGQSMFIGGMVEALSDPFNGVVKKALNLSGLGYTFDNGFEFSGSQLEGIGDFAIAPQIQGAVPSGPTQQYPFPVAPAQVAESAAVSNALHDYDVSAF